MKDIKKEFLKELGIYELRELARVLNVPSPTTKKREQLEDDIIIYSKNQTLNEPNFKSKKGRPPKSVKKIDSLLDVFVPKEFAEIVINKRVDNELSDYFKFCKPNQHDIIKIATGFARKTMSGEFYIRDNSNFDTVAALSLKLIAQFNIIEGDKIFCRITKANDDRFYNVDEIFKINDKQPSSERQILIENELVLPSQKIKGFDDVEEGGKVVFVGDTFKSNVEKIKAICSEYQEEYNIIMLAPNISTYHKLLIQNQFKADFIYTLLEDHPSYIYDAVTNCMNYANVLMSENKKVLVVVFDLFGIKRGIENYFVVETNQVNLQQEIESARITLKLLDMAKATKNGGNITVFATCMTHEQDQPFFQNYIRKNVDTILML